MIHALLSHCGSYSASNAYSPISPEPFDQAKARLPPAVRTSATGTAPDRHNSRAMTEEQAKASAAATEAATKAAAAAAAAKAEAVAAEVAEAEAESAKAVKAARIPALESGAHTSRAHPAA